MSPFAPRGAGWPPGSDMAWAQDPHVQRCEPLQVFRHLSGLLPNLSGCLPNLSGFLPNLSGFLPNLSGFLPNLSGFLIAVADHVSIHREIRDLVPEIAVVLEGLVALIELLERRVALV